MDSSPITAWTHASAYFTFASHESVILAILALSVVITFAVIGGIMRHEKRSEAALAGATEKGTSLQGFATESEG